MLVLRNYYQSVALFISNAALDMCYPMIKLLQRPVLWWFLVLYALVVRSMEVPRHHHQTSSDNYYQASAVIHGWSKNSESTTISKIPYQSLNSAFAVGRSRREVTNASETEESDSICDKLCRCIRENALFLNVECDFVANKKFILSGRTSIPWDAITLQINLGPHTHLAIDEHAVRDKKLNRISINGGTLKKQSIDIGPRAFHDNNAPFPEIDLRNVQTLTIREIAFKGQFKLNVVNVENVIVQSNGFYNTTFHGLFANIADLRFETKAFTGTKSSKIEIIDSYVGLLERMDAAMREIKMINSRIEKIKSNTFDVLGINSIVFINCDINVIETNTTTEKLYSNYLGIIGCRIGTIQPGAISNSGISEVLIENNSIETIAENAISVTSINVSILHNVIPKTEQRWLNIKQWSTINVYNNSFGQLGAIDIDRNTNRRSCIFQHNSITQSDDDSLKAFGVDNECHLKENIFAKTCLCNLEWLDKISKHADLRSSSYCQIDNALRHCFNSTTFNVQTYYEAVCTDNENAIDCQKNMAVKKVQANFVDPDTDHYDQNGDARLQYIIGGCVILIAILIVVSIIILCTRCQNKDASATVSVSHQFQTSTLSASASNTIREFTRLFTVEDRMIIGQALEKIRTKQSEETYEQVLKNTKRLMDKPLSETEKVLTIGEIVRLLEECGNVGEDMMAFTDILYRHLDDSSNGPILDPVYAEPTAIAIQPTESSTPAASQHRGNHVDPDHIYAEPNSAQQPLLRMDYSQPIDNRGEHFTNVYADPVSQSKDTHTTLISPYAITNPLPMQLPGSNLPDVLARIAPPSSKPTTIQELPKVNTFSPPLPQNPGPSKNNCIPMYALPLKGPNGGGKRPPNAMQTSYATDNISSSSSSNDSTNHSGGSDITCQIDDMVVCVEPKG